MYQKIIHKRYQKRRIGILLLIATLLIAAVCLLWHYGVDFFSRSGDYDDLIREAADRHCVDSLLVKAVIWRESRFNRHAIGKKGEIGLMQIMREWAVTDWAKKMGVDVPSEAALFSPRLNIEIGTWYLAESLRKWAKYKEYDALALAEYNAGRSVVIKWRPTEYDGDFIGRIGYESTKNYVVTIISKYEEYAVCREAE